MQRLLPLLIMLLTLAAVAPAAGQGSQPMTISHADTGSAAHLDAEGGPAPPMAPAVYHMAETMPAFPGGTAAQVAFLREKLKYPEEALRKGLAGKVLVQFVVDERGHLLDPQVVRGLGAGLDEEALRLVRVMPWWTPGLVGGQPVKVQVTLPIVFRALE